MGGGGGWGGGVGRRAMGHVAACGDVGTSTNVASPTACCVMVRQHDVRCSFGKFHIYHVYVTVALHGSSITNIYTPVLLIQGWGLRENDSRCVGIAMAAGLTRVYT